VQQLTVLGSVSGSILSAEERSRFDYELKNYHAVDVDTVASLLGSSVTVGLSAAAAAAALKKHGSNVLSPPRDWPLGVKFIFSMFSGFAPLLWAAVIVCFVCWANLAGGLPALTLAIVLAAITFVGGAFVFWQEFQTARVLAGFKNMIPTVAQVRARASGRGRARAYLWVGPRNTRWPLPPPCPCVQVTRDGNPRSLTASELTVGDLVTLTAGSKVGRSAFTSDPNLTTSLSCLPVPLAPWQVPADVRILTTHGLRVDNSLLTGENEPVRLYSEPQANISNSLEARNMAFMGAAVTEGSGTAIVVAVGDSCQIGRIAAMSSGASSKLTSLQKDLNVFVAIVGAFALFFFTLVLVVWGAWLKPQHTSFMSLPAALLNAMVRSVLGGLRISKRL
jgi:sodium/potassium-transporting ATPase subunit alpha